LFHAGFALRRWGQSMPFFRTAKKRFFSEISYYFSQLMLLCWSFFGFGLLAGGKMVQVCRLDLGVAQSAAWPQAK
jgi:hypothetical protein